MTDRDREHVRQGSHTEPGATDAFRAYLASLLPEVAPSLEERVVWLTEELIRARKDHQDTCHLAWELYLAGTGQTGDSFRGVTQDPVTDVRQAVAAIAGGVLTPAPETRNVTPDVPQPRRNDER